MSAGLWRASRSARIGVVRQVPGRGPKFHQAEMFWGMGRSQLGSC